MDLDDSQKVEVLKIELLKLAYMSTQLKDKSKDDILKKIGKIGKLLEDL